MKHLLGWILLLMPSIALGAADINNPCTTAKVLTQIRPGAVWALKNDSMKTIKWLDTKQRQPTVVEVEKARQVCIADTQARDELKGQARLEVKNPNTPVEKKVNDLVLLLDMDR